MTKTQKQLALAAAALALLWWYLNRKKPVVTSNITYGEEVGQ